MPILFSFIIYATMLKMEAILIPKLKKTPINKINTEQTQYHKADKSIVF